jgi:hypothetical protein
MPWGDRQFWVVSLVAIGAGLKIMSILVPKKRKPRTTLTISARPRD